MIRRSTAIATATILLSLLVHLFGLSFTAPVPEDQPAGEAATDVVALGNAFEDIAEALAEPVAPEPAPIPEPPVEQPPEPDTTEIPTSEALVASDNPQDVLSPGTGPAAAPVQPEVTTPPEPEAGSTPEPATVPPTGGEAARTAETAVSPPVDPGAPAQAAGGPQQLAALPVPVIPAPPVAPVPEISAIPVVPVEPDTVTPEISEPAEEPAPDVTEPAENTGSELAVAASPRPERRPATDVASVQDELDAVGDLRPAPSQLIESPLTRYQRDGVDLTVGESRSAAYEGLGFQGSQGPGNSDVTNYVGRVLVHLNNAPPVRVSDRGAARVFFEINPDGSLAWVDVIDSSGSLEVNRAAKTQVRNAAPFPPPPQGRSRKIAFVYRIN